MASFTVNVRTDSSAFDNDMMEIEVANILRNAADLIENGDTDFLLRDSFGNTTGFVEFISD